jgi:arsenate reductase-like glutaredoxin family protein
MEFPNIFIIFDKIFLIMALDAFLFIERKGGRFEYHIDTKITYDNFSDDAFIFENKLFQGYSRRDSIKIYYNNEMIVLYTQSKNFGNYNKESEKKISNYIYNEINSGNINIKKIARDLKIREIIKEKKKYVPKLIMVDKDNEDNEDLSFSLIRDSKLITRNIKSNDIFELNNIFYTSYIMHDKIVKITGDANFEFYFLFHQDIQKYSIEYKFIEIFEDKFMKSLLRTHKIKNIIE